MPGKKRSERYIKFLVYLIIVVLVNVGGIGLRLAAAHANYRAQPRPKRDFRLPWRNPWAVHAVNTAAP